MKKPILDLDKEEAKVYLAKIRENRYKITILVDCFPAAKWPRDQSSSSDTVLNNKHQDRNLSWSTARKVVIVVPTIVLDFCLNRERGN